MKLTGEQKIGIILLVVGMVIVVGSQIMIEKHGLLTVNITPADIETWPKWKPLEYSRLDCPTSLIYQQEFGIVIATIGATLLVRPFIFESERKFDRTAAEGVR
jgi:hypothetical protein